jgi:glycosyltransferase involved in cell wall biosynthesis
MNSRAEITVVIPCFNDGYFLEASLMSAVSQTLPPFEIIVVNDGSTDPRTLRILRDLKKPGVIIIDQDNRGLAGARNTGMHNAKGRYVYFLDADDLIVPQCLEKLSGLLEKHESAIAAVSSIQLFGGPKHGMLWGQACNPYVIRIQNQWGAGIMLRNEAVRKHSLWYDESMRSGYEDWELNIRLAKTGEQILFCQDALYRYRIRKKSLLSTSRKRHVEVVRYIQAKHSDLYAYDSLLKAKRTHAVALLVSCNDEEKTELETWLGSQTFADWALDKDPTPQECRYHLFYASLQALGRLPTEALECALIALERYSRARHCVIAVRKDCSSLFADPNQSLNLNAHRYPVALVTRENEIELSSAPAKLMSECDLLIEFIDQRLLSGACWEPTLVRVSANSVMGRCGGPESVRKALRSAGREILGDEFQHRCIELYDRFYYSILCSNEAFTVRRKIKTVLGAKAEHFVASLFYGLFLTNPPHQGDGGSIGNYGLFSEKIAPFFARPADQRIHILIATAWLVEGGVEQIIFELCTLLDPSRFRVTIVTTLPSAQSWDGLARKTGASVYHLADFLKPADMTKGLLHLMLNHHVDCMFIMNSEAAYRAAKTIKRIVPWLPIIDRIEAPDPGGGYPMISAEVGRQFIDLRTVSHIKLAELINQKYRLAKGSVRVIYIGTSAARMEKIASNPRGRLHDLCGVSLETPVVLFVGRFANQKRPEVFVHCVAKVFELSPNCEAHFAMVGDGPLMKSVKRLISEYRLSDRIHLLGAHPNAAELIADARILMMPSAYEGVALVSYEAMALGIPQIFANVGGQNELITPETGILIENGSGEETRYARACLDLLSAPRRLKQMAEFGKQRMRLHFSAKTAVNEYAEIFERFAASSRKQANQTPHLDPPHIEPLYLSTV